MLLNILHKYNYGREKKYITTTLMTVNLPLIGMQSLELEFSNGRAVLWEPES